MNPRILHSQTWCPDFIIELHIRRQRELARIIHSGHPLDDHFTDCNEWVISDRDGNQLRSLTADWLSRQSVMDLEVTHRRK